jgi:hypothetical protein
MYTSTAVLYLYIILYLGFAKQPGHWFRLLEQPGPVIRGDHAAAFKHS